MAYTTSEARQELLDTVAQAANELGFASACLAGAYEQLDEYNVVGGNGALALRRRPRGARP